MAGRTRPAARRPTRPNRPRRPTAAERQKARIRRRRINQAAAVLAALVLAGTIAFAVAANARHHRQQIAQLTSGGCRFDQRSDPGRNHVTDPTYRINPPSGGDHDPAPAPAKIFTAADTPSDGQLVHSLEHGYVILWYRPDDPAEQLQAIDQIESQFSNDVLVVPRPSLPAPVAATAWHQRLLCPALDQTALTRFVGRFRNQGPEKVPH